MARGGIDEDILRYYIDLGVDRNKAVYLASILNNQPVPIGLDILTYLNILALVPTDTDGRTVVSTTGLEGAPVRGGDDIQGLANWFATPQGATFVGDLVAEDLANPQASRITSLLQQSTLPPSPPVDPRETREFQEAEPEIQRQQLNQFFAAQDSFEAFQQNQAAQQAQGLQRQAQLGALGIQFQEGAQDRQQDLQTRQQEEAILAGTGTFDEKLQAVLGLPRRQVLSGAGAGTSDVSFFDILKFMCY